MNSRLSEFPEGVLVTALPFVVFLKCPRLLPGVWKITNNVSLNPANELPAMHMSVLVMPSTLAPGGSTPFSGSTSRPQLVMVAFN